jgi:hypothetical protein
MEMIFLPLSLSLLSPSLLSLSSFSFFTLSLLYLSLSLSLSLSFSLARNVAMDTAKSALGIACKNNHIYLERESVCVREREEWGESINWHVFHCRRLFAGSKISEKSNAVSKKNCVKKTFFRKSAITFLKNEIFDI